MGLVDYPFNYRENAPFKTRLLIDYKGKPISNLKDSHLSAEGSLTTINEEELKIDRNEEESEFNMYSMGKENNLS